MRSTREKDSEGLGETCVRLQVLFTQKLGHRRLQMFKREGRTFYLGVSRFVIEAHIDQ